MKKKLTIFFLFFTFFTNAIFAQADLNLDFDLVARDRNSAVGWSSTGSHIAFLDDKIKKHGENSIRLENAPNNDDRAWSYYTNQVILSGYSGKEITLRGYIKTENLTGSAGFYMHQQGGSYFKLETINLDNMEKRRLQGTNNWTPLILKMSLPPNLYQIEFGVYIEGKGKIWADDLKLLIDGKPYQLAANTPEFKKPEESKEEKNTPNHKKKAQETMRKHKN
jgi:hypothetical protein